MATQEQLDAARLVRQQEGWDTRSVTTVHLPTEQAEDLLRHSGWRVEVTEKPGGQDYQEYVAPDGVGYWHLDDALAVALISEVM